jgi:hypothetical protein
MNPTVTDGNKKPKYTQDQEKDNGENDTHKPHNGEAKKGEQTTEENQDGGITERGAETSHDTETGTNGKTGAEDGIHVNDGTTNEEGAENTTQEDPTVPDQQRDLAEAMEDVMMTMEGPGQMSLKVSNGSTPTTSSDDETLTKQPQTSTKRQKN